MGYSPWGCKRAGHDLVTKQQQWKLRNTVNTEKYGHCAAGIQGPAFPSPLSPNKCGDDNRSRV